MAAAEAERRPGAAEGRSLFAEGTAGQPQTSQSPAKGDQGLVPAPEVCWAQGEEKCPAGLVLETEGRLKLPEERLKPEVEVPEERGSRLLTAIVRPIHGPKRKPVALPGPSHQAHPRAETELPLGLPLPREEPEGSQGEPSPSVKQHKKAKKRKSLGVLVPPAAASAVAAPSEALGLERKAQRLRPLYQYINYCNPELNQADEGDREAEAEAEGEPEPVLVPEEARPEQLQALLPVTEEAGEERGGLLSPGAHLRAEVDKSTQVHINKMLSVCAAPLVPPLSPQYK